MKKELDLSETTVKKEIGFVQRKTVDFFMRSNQLIEYIWEKRNLDQIKKINRLVEIIEKESPKWFKEDEKEVNLDKKIGLALKVYTLRRGDVQIFKNFGWIIIGVCGLFSLLFRLII